jgi:acyl-CoA synthetase (AMP-forming)/AMP-acid ligase II
LVVQGLVDLLSDAAAAGCAVEFLPSGASWSVGRLLEASESAARWLTNKWGDSAPVAVAMDNTPEALAVFIGACRSGRRIVSLPMPPRGTALTSYQRFIEHACSLTGAEALLVSGAYRPFIPELAVGVDTFEAAQATDLDHIAFRDDPVGTELVQFTSGSTSDPKGVVLPLERLATNVLSILDVLSPVPGDVSCSWLPLSHDMGLVGMALSALCAGGARWVNGGTVVLIKPEWFIRRPESWLDACDAFGATITAAPDFGFVLATRLGATSSSLDLHRLRACITGAEPVRADTLRRFEKKFAPFGFDATTFCPAYGMAEASLAVTMTRPDEHWSSLHLDPDDLALGVVTEMTSAGPRTELVSAGRPLAGYRVSSTAGTGHVGTLTVDGPSLFDRYIGSATAARTDEGFLTHDAGFLHNNKVYIQGRLDDVVLIGGRKLYLSDIDQAATSTGAIAHGHVQSVADGDGFHLVAEHTGGVEDPLRVAHAIRRAVVGVTGIGPSAVLIIERGSLPRTSTGKPRRQELSRQIRNDELAVIHRHTFSA